MDDFQKEVLDIFTNSGALLKGHFVLRSGLHSERFFQCARVCERLDYVERLAYMLLSKLPSGDFDSVLSPAMGGLVIGQELARQAKKRFIFVEKVGDALALRRGFKIEPGERFLVVEDVITRGGRVREALNILDQHKAKTVGVAVLVNRGGDSNDFGVPMTGLLQLSFPTYKPDEIPEELAKIPAIKPGS